MSKRADTAFRFARQHGGTVEEGRLEAYLTGFAASYGGYTGSESAVSTAATESLFNGYRREGYSPDEALDELFLDGYAEGKIAKATGK